MPTQLSLTSKEFIKFNKENNIKEKRKRNEQDELYQRNYKSFIENNMCTLFIKPLSVNEAFKGRRFHTKKHKHWSAKINEMLPKSFVVPKPPFEIYLKFGFSSSASDWDNCIKQCQDSIAGKYKFNDKLIKRGVVETEIVKKGEEYFKFSLIHYNR